MKSLKYSFKSGEEGKGAAGCIVALFLMAVVIFLSIKLGPPYISHYEFKGEVKQAVSRFGARSISDENIKRDLISTAEKNNIPLKNENIQIRRFAGRINIDVEYTIPVNLLILNHNLRFRIEESSITM